MMDTPPIRNNCAFIFVRNKLSGVDAFFYEKASDKKRTTKCNDNVLTSIKRLCYDIEKRGYILWTDT